MKKHTDVIKEFFNQQIRRPLSWTDENFYQWQYNRLNELLATARAEERERFVKIIGKNERQKRITYSPYIYVRNQFRKELLDALKGDKV